jgi:hypothetical protein
MARFCAVFLGLWMALLWSAPASASGDFGCTPDWKLGHVEMSGCDDMALLGPSNDTRTNFLLLLADQHHRGTPAAPGQDPIFGIGDLYVRWYPGLDPADADTSNYATGEGSRCLSNTVGNKDFAAAVRAAAGLSPAERDTLIATRDLLQPNCNDSSNAAAIDDAAARMKSATAREFARYLVGACAFYEGNYDKAAGAFAAAQDARAAWVKETARYMLARVEINRAQIGAYDEYGFPAHFDQISGKTIDAAEARLQDYLKAYPVGIYANSAIGLMRRVHWLGGRTGRLVGDYVALFDQDPAKRGFDDGALADEIDNKLLPGIKPDQVSNPLLLAVVDLERMRASNSGDASITRAQIEAQKSWFAKNPPLHEYLVAAHAYFAEANYKDVLRLIPDAARQGDFSYLQFSRQMLRGMALEALKDRNARGFWLEMIGGAKRDWQRPAVELAIALHDERSNGLAKVFAADSQVRSPAIREILLMYAAGPDLLRQQARSGPAHEREVALFTLLYKGLTRGAYAGFVSDIAMVPAGATADSSIYDLSEDEHVPLGIFTRAPTVDGYNCPALKITASQLAANPRDYKARLCLGDFIRLTGFDEHPLDSPPDADELGGAPSQFPGGNFSRLEIYKAIIADPRAPGPEKAYALYRAINCYGPSGNNACGGTEVDLPVRKGWFQQLKRDYPKSVWAQDLKYYW